jgi:hypothetical protein
MSARRKPDPNKQVVHDEVNRVRLFKGCTHPYVDGEPSGYLAWHSWSNRMAKTHKQRQCPDCGLYVFWDPK